MLFAFQSVTKFASKPRKFMPRATSPISAKAERSIDYLESIGMGSTPVCMAKTQYSLSDDASRLGRPTGFRITVNEVYPAAGAGFVVAQAGDIMTMPGLPREPAAERMAIHPDGSIVGLF